MANRNDSDARQHETLPGFGAAPVVGAGHHHAANEAGGVRPVEQMVDAAIERIAREQGASAHFERERSDAASALVKPDANPMPARLRWKGLDVSDEFREYAERVARGEDLPPFEGRVLAEPNPAFPWGAPAAPEEAAPSTGVGAKVAVWSSVLLALGLLGWSLVPRVEAGSGNALEPAPGVIATERLTTDGVATDATKAEASAAREGPAPEVTSAALLPAPSATPPVIAPVPASPVAVVEPSAVHSSIAPPGTEDAPSDPVPPPPSAVTPAPAAPVAAKVPPQPPAPSPAATPPAASAPPAAVKSVPQDEFGIMQLEDPAPAPAAAAKPTGASDGERARAGQTPPGPVRKEPGSESSAKGSLLIETPSF